MSQYGTFCPLAKALDVIGERWTLLVIREFFRGSCRFSDFQRNLSKMSPTLLTKRLRDLQKSGLVVKKTVPGQNRTEYYLTPAGKELEPVVMSLGLWGMKWARGQMTQEDLDVELMMSEIERRVDPTHLPAGRNVIRFVFPELNDYKDWWVIINEEGEVELCINNPSYETDVTVRCDLRALIEVYMGDREMADARKAGDITLGGEPVIIKQFADWLPLYEARHIKYQDPRESAKIG